MENNSKAFGSKINLLDLDYQDCGMEWNMKVNMLKMSKLVMVFANNIMLESTMANGKMT